MTSGMYGIRMRAAIGIVLDSALCEAPSGLGEGVDLTQGGALRLRRGADPGLVCVAPSGQVGTRQVAIVGRSAGTRGAVPVSRRRCILIVLSRSFAIKL